MLEAEKDIFAKKLDDWLATQAGRFVVIKGADVLGFYNTLEEALTAGAAKFGAESFLAKRVSRDEEVLNVPALTLGMLRANP